MINSRAFISSAEDSPKQRRHIVGGWRGNHTSGRRGQNASSTVPFRPFRMSRVPSRTKDPGKHALSLWILQEPLQGPVRNPDMVEMVQYPSLSCPPRRHRRSSRFGSNQHCAFLSKCKDVFKSRDGVDVKAGTRGRFRGRAGFTMRGADDRPADDRLTGDPGKQHGT